MSLLALGLNHKTAPVDIREQVTFGPEHIESALHELVAVPMIDEAAIVATCNRTEIYCNLQTADSNDPKDPKDPSHPAAQPLEWFLKHHGIHTREHDQLLYQFIDANSVQHLFKVACGLDSMVLGEPQILGQLKSAYRQAQQAGTLGLQLEQLFQQAFSVAKQVRTQTGIGNNPISVAFAAVQLSKQIFTDLNAQTALMIGAGETIELVAQHLDTHGIGKLLVANRSVDKAADLANRFDGVPLQLADLTDHLPEADIIVSSTASQLPIIGKGAVESALKKRKHQPIFMIDIAVPRDIEPEVGKLEDVYLYNIDDLENVIEENQRSRQAAAVKAETIIDAKVADFMAWQRSLDAAHVIRNYRHNATQLSESALLKAKQMLAQGKSADEALEFLAHSLTNKLLHDTTSRLNQAARNGRHDILDTAHELFKPKSDRSR